MYVQNLCKNRSKYIQSDNFCYRKIGRAITKQEQQRKVQYCYCNIGHITIYKGNKNYFAFSWQKKYIRRLYIQLLLFHFLRQQQLTLFYAPEGNKRATTITIKKGGSAFKKTDTKIEAKKIKSDNYRQQRKVQYCYCNIGHITIYKGNKNYFAFSWQKKYIRRLYIQLLLFQLLRQQQQSLFYAPKGKKRATTITITKVGSAFKKTDTKNEEKKIKSDNYRQQRKVQYCYCNNRKIINLCSTLIISL